MKLDLYLDPVPDSDPAAAAIAIAAAAAEYLDHKVAVAAMINEVIGALDARREYLGLSKAELARRMGRDRAAVSRLLNPSRAQQGVQHPSLGTLADLAYALGLELDVQLRERPERVPIEWPERIRID
jgi:ribosome-binding protein aMBF1 (putative translation factor)